MLPYEVRGELYESKPIRNLPIGIQDDLLVTFENVMRRYYTMELKESDNDVADTIQSVQSVSNW